MLLGSLLVAVLILLFAFAQGSAVVSSSTLHSRVTSLFNFDAECNDGKGNPKPGSGHSHGDDSSENGNPPPPIVPPNPDFVVAPPQGPLGLAIGGNERKVQPDWNHRDSSHSPNRHWVFDGFIEISENIGGCNLPLNRTIIPLGVCVHNIFPGNGPANFIRMAALQPDDNGNGILSIQGFSDKHCGTHVGPTQNGAFGIGCQGGFEIFLGHKRRTHAMGATHRFFPRGDCKAAHIDVWHVDGVCHPGGVINAQAKSHVASCANNFAVEFDQDNCAGNANYLQIDQLPLGHCLVNDDHGFQLVCGGKFPAPSDMPTISPPLNTAAPTVVIPANTNAPTIAIPENTDAPTVAIPSNTDSPTVAIPQNTDAPTVAIPSNTDSPTVAIPVNTDAPTTSIPANTASPSPAATAAPPTSASPSPQTTAAPTPEATAAATNSQQPPGGNGVTGQTNLRK